ncbi:hypothetical protein GWI33_019984 [Rhynchophorus ferrugineus]|uniref:UDP-glucuronosyltransferase n=1 Tax=Rhynchophorus ferrugineus TaxID=354439 RepID=A0A834LZX6_RHYFE|nr:hypothetical protein GWI33_019984 [Rhynchophorus ferrugineus]
MRMLLISLIPLTLLLNSVYGLKLLLVFATPSKSHYILGNALGKDLANFGHEVTVIGAYSESNPPKNYKQIVVTDLVKKREARERPHFMYKFENMSPILQMLIINNVIDMVVDTFFNSTEIQTFLQSQDEFDAVIVEQYLTDPLGVLAYHFKAPLILFSTIGSNRWINTLVGNPEPSSYIPDMLLGGTGEMTFNERAYNFLYSIVAQLNLHFIVYPKYRSYIAKYFPNIQNFDEILYNVSLVLLNSHESINHAVPHVPNIVDIGGFHVKPPKNLSGSLQDFMDDARDGVIYFSMGSNLKPSAMPKETKEIILKVLGSRKEKVLWKWDEDILENQPENVKISKWFPQQDILAHPNCKLFITHGGLLSTTETVSMGVPVLAFPIFADQKLNAGRAEALGFGKSLPFGSITEEKLSSALEELLSNPKYLKNAKLRSQLIHDRPMEPSKLADYWIKYVVKYKGAPHLRVAGAKLSFYQYWMLDVIFVYGGGFVISIYLLIKIRRSRKNSKANRQKKLQ